MLCKKYGAAVFERLDQAEPAQQHKSAHSVFRQFRSSCTVGSHILTEPGQRLMPPGANLIPVNKDCNGANLQTVWQPCGQFDGGSVMAYLFLLLGLLPSWRVLVQSIS